MLEEASRTLDDKESSEELDQVIDEHDVQLMDILF